MYSFDVALIELYFLWLECKLLNIQNFISLVFCPPRA